MSVFVCVCVCLCVCLYVSVYLSVLEHIYRTTRATFTKFSYLLNLPIGKVTQFHGE